MKVAVIMGSKSDMPVLESTISTLKEYGVETVVKILSAHRTPSLAEKFARGAKSEGIEVIICAAGKAAHLAGVFAGLTTLPVIGLPIKSSFMDGMDSLLSTVQMPSGIPVATVGVNAGENAALLAVQILALKYPGLDEKLEEHKKQMEEAIIAANESLQ